MALNSAALKSAIQSVFASYPATAHDCAIGLSGAILTYSSSAQSCSVPGLPIALAAAQPALQSGLESAFSGTTAAAAASGIASAMTAFWTGQPFSGVTPGAVTVVAGGGALQAALISNWTSNVASNGSASDAAQGMADAIDIFTKAIVVAHAAPSACVSTLL